MIAAVLSPRAVSAPASRRWFRTVAKAPTLVFLCTLGLAASAAVAQPTPLPPLSERAVASGAVTSVEQGIEFVTIGAPGNAGYAGGQFGNNAGAGAVSEAFRIARTQVTNAQIVEFANAYLPHILARGDNPREQLGILGSTFIGYDQQQQRYVTTPQAALFPAMVSWRIAARYCNWLCNDRRTDLAAFETGAYDTSTFGNGPNGTFTDQLTHNTSARFFLPTRDQWVKAAFYDPNRNGPGVGGYWQYPHSSETAPIYGFPWEGGESIVGREDIPLFSWVQPVASYVNTQSPWGLFDLTGSARDWNEDPTPDLTGRLLSGTGYRDAVPDLSDSLYYGFALSGRVAWPLDGIVYGFRVAAIVPTPSTGLAMLLVTALFRQRRRKEL